MSLELAIISALAGVALGLRYKVMILIRAVALVATFAMMVGIARGDHVWSIISAIAILGTAVQLGYLAGISIRATVGWVLVPHAQAALLRQALSRHARQEAASAFSQGASRTVGADLASDFHPRGISILQHAPSDRNVNSTVPPSS